MFRSRTPRPAIAAVPLHAVPLALAVLLALGGCAHTPLPGTPLSRRGDEIMACGQLFHTGTPVVLWTDPGGYDAYRVDPHFTAEPAANELPREPRFGDRRNLPPDVAEHVARRGWSLADLQQVVRMFVVHYDVCGTSRQCFKVLHDRRGLSVHFLLDVDGTIYQTLDLKERAWHATVANDASVGIEIAHIGAYPSPDDGTLKSWYRTDADGPRVSFPSWMKKTGVRTPGFVARPARPELLHGVVHGKTYYQYDFTEQQYRALAKLVATLHRVLPRIELRVPRDGDGQVLPTTLDADQLAHFAGVLGHWHVSRNKTDPGPAFDWERILTDASMLQ